MRYEASFSAAGGVVMRRSSGPEAAINTAMAANASITFPFIAGPLSALIRDGSTIYCAKPECKGENGKMPKPEPKPFIREILQALRMDADAAVPYRDAEAVASYLLDDRLLLKISESAMDDQMKADKAKALPTIPRIRSSGSFTLRSRTYFFVLMDYIQGMVLLDAIPKLSDEQQRGFGREIADFLGALHAIKDDRYDMGHYVPTVPRYGGSWKEGHRAYAGEIKNGLSGVPLEPASRKLFAEAFDYIETHSGVLEYQTGPALLHNDFHPKNIIVRDGKLAGVIDWECAQFGEPDFELTHLFHWCIYPPEPDKTFPALLRSVTERFQAAAHVPGLAERLTIYQLEHDMNQIVWRGKAQEAERVRHVEGWLSEGINELINSWTL